MVHGNDEPVLADKRMSATDKIRAHLKRGRSITALQALEMYGCMRLGARIYDLKQSGMDIKKHTVELRNGKRVAEYYL